MTPEERAKALVLTIRGATYSEGDDKLTRLCAQAIRAAEAEAYHRGLLDARGPLTERQGQMVRITAFGPLFPGKKPRPSR